MHFPGALLTMDSEVSEFASLEMSKLMSADWNLITIHCDKLTHRDWNTVHSCQSLSISLGIHRGGNNLVSDYSILLIL